MDGAGRKRMRRWFNNEGVDLFPFSAVFSPPSITVLCVNARVRLTVFFTPTPRQFQGVCYYGNRWSSRKSGSRKRDAKALGNLVRGDEAGGRRRDEAAALHLSSLQMQRWPSPLDSSMQTSRWMRELLISSFSVQVRHMDSLSVNGEKKTHWNHVSSLVNVGQQFENSILDNLWMNWRRTMALEFAARQT